MNTRKKYFYKIIIALLLIIILLLLLLLFTWKQYLVPKASDMVITTIGKQAGLSSEAVEEITNSLSASEQETIQRITSSLMTNPQTVKEVVTSISTNDKESLKKIAKEKLTPSQKEELSQIYYQHQGQITPELMDKLQKELNAYE